jgi:hypothetical protein
LFWDSGGVGAAGAVLPPLGASQVELQFQFQFQLVPAVAAFAIALISEVGAQFQFQVQFQTDGPEAGVVGEEEPVWDALPACAGALACETGSADALAAPALAPAAFVCVTGPSSPGLSTRIEMFVLVGAVWLEPA